MPDETVNLRAQRSEALLSLWASLSDYDKTLVYSFFVGYDIDLAEWVVDWAQDHP